MSLCHHVQCRVASQGYTGVLDAWVREDGQLRAIQAEGIQVLQATKSSVAKARDPRPHPGSAAVLLCCSGHAIRTGHF